MEIRLDVRRKNEDDVLLRCGTVSFLCIFISLVKRTPSI